MDESLHYLIMANQMLVQKSLMEELKGSSLTSGQPKILDYLKDHNGSNQKEIAQACFLEAGSLTSILNKMEEKDLVKRKILNGNRRSFHIFLTEKGFQQQILVQQSFQSIEKIALKNVSEEERQTFLSISIKMYENLKEQIQNKKGNEDYE